MPNSDAVSRIPLHAIAADKGTEIFLVNADFRRLMSAVGELRTEVEPGIYKLRFRSGDTMADQFVEVPPRLPAGQGEILVRGAPLGFASALPMPHTRTSHEYHQGAWEHARNAPDLRLGSGSGLFVLVRDVEKRPDKPWRHLPWQGLTLRDLDGRLLLDFARAPQSDRDYAYAYANLELDPGTYLLRVDTELNGVLEMPIVTCASWQTQVALRSRSISRRAPSFPDVRHGGSVAKSRSVRRAELAGATVLMSRPGGSVASTDEQDRLTELARLGLVQGRVTVRPDDLRSMLWAKADNPMLGIYGAHLLLDGDTPDMGLLREVVGNLESLLDGHPDVAALRLALDRRGGQLSPSNRRFDTPPMLARSWQLVVDASLEQPDLVPDGSFAALIATNLVSSSHWLMWRRTPALARTLHRGLWSGGLNMISPPVLTSVLGSAQRAVGRSTAGVAFLGQDFSFARGPAISRRKAQADRPSAERSEPPARNLTPMQQAVFHEAGIAENLSFPERVERVARDLRLPPAAVAATLGGILSRGRKA